MADGFCCDRRVRTVVAACTIVGDAGVIEHRWFECTWYVTDGAILFDIVYNRHDDVRWCRIVGLTCGLDAIVARITAVTDHGWLSVIRIGIGKISCIVTVITVICYSLVRWCRIIDRAASTGIAILRAAIVA